LILFAAAPVRAASVKLAWDPTPNPAVVGYKIHYGVETGKYTQTIQVQGRLTTNAVVENLEEGKIYFFAITSYDAKGGESAYSIEMTNGATKNQRPPARRSKALAGPGKASGLHAPQNEKNGSTASRAPSDKKKISHSRRVPRTPEGKILPSR
jgi:fibronectin type 3 domain-containing protein